MDLSPQDALRLNVLLANQPQAIRINASTMTVFGLSDKGEAQIQLNPTGREETYLKRVKEMLSGHVLGSPGGYPVYLQRWTRMGQMRDDSLEQLLLLGEPEAVVAAVCAQGLTDELARRAWWAMEDAGNARHMLCKRAVVNGRMGPLLAAYLVEHLPFESEPEQQIETVRLVLQEGLLTAEQIDALWRKAQRKPAYYVGFLAARADDLPEAAAAHPAHAGLSAQLVALAAAGNAVAGRLERVLSPGGQAFVETVFRVFDKPSNQDVVNLALDAIATYFAAVRPQGPVDATLDELRNEADDWMTHSDDAIKLSLLPDIDINQIKVLRILSGLSYGVVRPVFGDSTAIGSLMRRKLQPVLTPLLEELSRLRAKAIRQ
ncbi:MAG: sulfur reduction protein DsrS [Gammaproteobacteria bacterium]|nr:sulfur reduction protein DsrS [Gammaproteobacteria bacterium]